MNTPAHLIFGAAVFARPGAGAVNAAALAGGLLPDLSLYLLVGWSLYVQGLTPDVVFGQLYFSDRWQGIFAVDNSFPVWAAGLGLAFMWRNAAAIAFAGSGLLHLIFDFLLHHDDARRQFWPLSDWVFRSPFSYWDNAHYGGVFGPLEVAVSLGLLVLLWRRFSGPVARTLIVLGAVLQAVPSVMFALMFAGP